MLLFKILLITRISINVTSINIKNNDLYKHDIKDIDYIGRFNIFLLFLFIKKAVIVIII